MTAELDIATLHEALAAEFGDEPCVVDAGRARLEPRAGNDASLA